MEALEELYWELLGAWNRKHAADFAALFAPDGSVVGFDGSQMEGRALFKARSRAFSPTTIRPGMWGRSGKCVPSLPTLACSGPSRA